MRFIIKINLSYNQLYYIMEMVQRPWCTAESFAMRLNNIKMNEYYSLLSAIAMGCSNGIAILVSLPIE